MKHITIATFAAVSAISTLVAQPSYSASHHNLTHHANIIADTHLQFQGEALCGCSSGGASVQTMHVPVKGFGIQMQATGDASNCFCDSVALAEVFNLNDRSLAKVIRFTVTPIGTGFDPNHFFVDVEYTPPGGTESETELSLANGGIQTNGTTASYKLRTGNGANSIPIGSTLQSLEFVLNGTCVNGPQSAFLQNVFVDTASVGVLQNESSFCSGGCG